MKPNLFEKIKPTSLRSQLIWGIALVHILLMSLFVNELINRQKTFFLKLTHDRALSQSVNLSNIAVSHVSAYELDGLQKFIATYKNIPGLEYAMITSDDGIVLAHTNKNYLGLKAVDNVSTKLKPIKATQILIENNHLIDVASPIIAQGKILGWARICLSQKYIEPNLWAIKKEGLYIFSSV